MRDHIVEALRESRSVLDRVLENENLLAAVDRAGQLMTEALLHGGRVFSCGNGGSMCDAIHFAEELSGRYRKTRKALAAVAISDPGHISCTANDFGWEHVFARYLEAHGRAGDVLVAISTSGTSSNVLVAVDMAKRLGMKVVSMTGRADSPLGARADVDLCVPAGRFSDRVQEVHIKIIHILIELVERSLFPELYRD